MPEGRDLEALFVQNLGAIERIASSICRRHGLGREDVEDFVSAFNARLVESGYAALGKFRGDSSLTTYLTVVIAMAFRDYRAQRWGRWRPSAVARAGGPLAVRLETLVYRDGLSFDQAVERLRSTGATDRSARELAEIVARLPRRAPLRPVEVGAESLAATPAQYGADDRVSSQSDEDERIAVEAALSRALGALPAEERLMIRMHYWDKLSIADVARVLALPQKSLYRRIDRALADLRTQLEASGVSREQAHSLVGTIGQ
jgi:RNA polymerase sigma factor (sigma-70 family)